MSNNDRTRAARALVKAGRADNHTRALRLADQIASGDHRRYGRIAKGEWADAGVRAVTMSHPDLTTEPPLHSFQHPIGFTADGEHMVMDLTHTAGAIIYGHAPSEKDALMRAVVLSALNREHRVYAVAAKMATHSWFSDLLNWDDCGYPTVEDAVRSIQSVQDQMESRLTLLGEHGASDWPQLPIDVQEDNPPITVVAEHLDYFATDESGAGQSLPAALSEIADRGRCAGIRLVVSQTHAVAASRGVPARLRMSLPYRVLVGSTTQKAQREIAFGTGEPMSADAEHAQARAMGPADAAPVGFSVYRDAPSAYRKTVLGRRPAT